MAFTLPQLIFKFDALEPIIDAQTMQIHHGKHHQAYVDKLNEAISKHPELENKSIEDLLMGLNDLPEDILTVVRNNGGGHWNHSFFWSILTPDSSKYKVQEGSKVHDLIQKYFGSYEEFITQFKNAALARFGSGWIWLVKMSDGLLKITSTPNQDNPLMPFSEVSGRPVLGLDVWEHAYYLKYQNKRADYVDAFWNIVNWEKVEELLG